MSDPNAITYARGNEIENEKDLYDDDIKVEPYNTSHILEVDDNAPKATT
jgi:hypothetical protein